MKKSVVRNNNEGILMSEVHTTSNDEINFLELFKILWNGKWKIIAITFVAAAIGIVYSAAKPNSFKVSTTIKAADQSVFLPYKAMNYWLKDIEFFFGEELSFNAFSVDNESIFNHFVNEFNDYEEMSEAISEAEIIKHTIKDLDGMSKERALIGFAKKFKIIKNKNNWLLQFEWHDESEGKRLISNAIKKTLIKVHNNIKNNILNINKLLDDQKSLVLRKIENDSVAILQFEKDKLKKRLKFLDEQSAIAAELGFDSNKFNTLSQISLNTEFPYYLQGYKAINKEISLIKSRSDEDILLMSNEDDMLKLLKKKNIYQQDSSAYQLKFFSKILESNNIDGWVSYDLNLAETKSQKKSMLYVALSIVLGVMASVIYVLISNSIPKHKGHSAKA